MSFPNRVSQRTIRAEAFKWIINSKNHILYPLSNAITSDGGLPNRNVDEFERRIHGIQGISYREQTYTDQPWSAEAEINDAIKKMVGKPAQTLDKALLIKEPLNLIVRTGDQYRLSNFMLYQASYANIYFEKKLWPEVTKRDFKKWIKWYYEQENKFGK